MADSVEDIIKRGRERRAQREAKAAAAEQAAAEPEDVSTLERIAGPKSVIGSAGLGLLKGASFGGMDELAGLISAGNAAAARVYGKTLGLSQEEVDDLIYTRTGVAPGSTETPYEAGKRINIQDYERAKAAHPWITGGAELAGGIVGGMALGPMLRGFSALRGARAVGMMPTVAGEVVGSAGQAAGRAAPIIEGEAAALSRGLPAPSLPAAPTAGALTAGPGALAVPGPSGLATGAVGGALARRGATGLATIGGEAAAEAAPEAVATAAPKIPGLTERLLGYGNRGIEFAAKEFEKALPAAALTAALSSEAPLSKGNVKGFAEEALLGTVEGTLGSVLGAGALKGAGKVAKAGAETLEEWGLKNLLKAISPNAQIADKLKQNNIKTPQDIRRFQEDVRRLGVVGPFSNAEDILERVNVKRDLEGPVIGKAVETADKRAVTGQAPYRPSRDLQRQAINREIAQEASTDELKAEALESAFSPINRTLRSDAQMASAGNPTTFEHLWKIKDTIRKMAQPKQASTDLASESFRDVADAYNKSFYKQLEDALPEGMAQQVKSSAYDYAQLSTIRKLTEESARRQALHKTMSLSDAIKGAMAAQATGNPALMLPSVAASVITKGRLPAMSAATEFAGQSVLEAGAKGAEVAAPYVRSLITSTSGPNSFVRDNAYRRLERRLGRKVRSDDELASEHFLDGQNNPESQPNRR